MSIYMEAEWADESWEPVDSCPEHNRSHLCRSAIIDGQSFHVDAIEVKMVNDIQQPVCEEDAGDIHALSIFSCPDGPFTTRIIDGRDYVIVFTPFC